MDGQLQKQHKEQKQGFLFLYALSHELKDRAKAEGFDVSDFISRLSKFYQVRELKSNTIVDAFAVTNQFKYIIILAHHNNDDSLVLSDESHLQLSLLISLLPDDLQGAVLDFAICKSDSIANIIKAKTHCEHVLSTKGYTDLKSRFLAYLFLPGYMKAHSETDDYLVAYSSCLSELKQKVGKNTLRPSTTKLGTMATSETPFSVLRNSNFHIRIKFHDESSEKIIEDNIKNAGNICYKIKESILKDIKDGDIIQVDLRFETTDPEMTKLIKIAEIPSYPFRSDNSKMIINIECYFEKGFVLNQFDGTLNLKIEDHLIDKWQFTTWVIPFIDDSKNDFSSNGSNNGQVKRLHGISYNPKAVLTTIPIAIHPQFNSEKREDNCSDEKPKEEICNNEQSGMDTLSREDKMKRIIQAIKKVVNDDLILKKQDWAAIYRVLQDTKYYTLTKHSFVDLIQNQCSSKRIVPASDSNLRKVVFYENKRDKDKYIYPNWKIEGMNDDETSRLIKLAQRFMSYL